MALDRTISLDVSYSREFDPDIVEFEIWMHGTCPSLETANDELAERIDHLRDQLVGAGVDGDSIATNLARVETDKVSVYSVVSPEDEAGVVPFRPSISLEESRPMYEIGQRIRGYSYDCRITANCPIANSNIDDIWSVLMGEVESYTDKTSIDVSYSISDEGQIRRQLQIDAIRHGEHEARTLARAAGAELGKIVKIDCSSRIADGFEVREYSSALYMSADKQRRFQMPKFDPKPIEVSCNVALEYELQG